MRKYLLIYVVLSESKSAPTHYPRLALVIHNYKCPTTQYQLKMM